MKIYKSFLIILLSMMVIMSPVHANEAMYQSAIKTFDKKMVRYESLLSKKQYGEKRWEKKVKKSRAKLFKSLKKMDKQFPKKDISSVWKKLKDTEQKYSPKGGANQVDPLYQLAVENFESKLKTFNRIADKKRFGGKKWSKDIKKNKAAVVKAIKKAEQHGSKQDIKELWAKWNKRESEFDKNHKIQLAKVLKQQAIEKEEERLEAERTSLKVKR